MNNINTDYENEFGVVYTDADEDTNDREAERREYVGYLDDNGEYVEEYLEKKYAYKKEYEVGMLFPIHPEEDIYFAKDDFRNPPYLIRKLYLDEVQNASTLISGDDECGIYMTEILPQEFEKIGKIWVLKQFIYPVMKEIIKANGLDEEKIDYIDILTDELARFEKYRNEMIQGIRENKPLRNN